MVAPVHKNTNAPLIPIICDVIFCMREKHYNRRILGVFRGGLNLFDPLEKPLEITDYVFYQHKKITSRTIRISGALIVNNCLALGTFQPLLRLRAVFLFVDFYIWLNICSAATGIKMYAGHPEKDFETGYGMGYSSPLPDSTLFWDILL